MSTFPSLNLEKLRNDTIKKLEKEKQTKETQEKLQQQKYDYQNYLNISHIKNSKQFKDMKEEYYDHDLLEKEFQDFLQHQQLYTSKQIIEEHIKDKSITKDLVPFTLRKEMKYLDEILTNRDKIRDR
jgi:hypothetical protein